MTKEREIKNWIEERRKGSDLMCKLFNRNKELKKENAELKKKLDKIRNYLVYDIFDRFKYLENLLKITQEAQKELSKRILEQIESLTDTIDELKAHCKAVDEVNAKMKCCGNCSFAIHNRLDGTFCSREAEYRQANEKCNKWELEE